MYFEWILMKYIVEIKDILLYMVVDVCICRLCMVYFLGKVSNLFFFKICCIYLKFL